MKIIIEGGKPLMGDLSISGAKNSAGRLLVAAILSEDESLIENVPDIEDIHITAKLLTECGVKVNQIERNSWLVNASGDIKSHISAENAGNSRAPAIFLAALAARSGKAIIPVPQGDKIGTRPLDRHLSALSLLGYQTIYQDGCYIVKAERPQCAQVNFAKSTHMGTNNVILVSCLIQGNTTITNAAQEPEVDEMIDFLNSMGAHIQRVQPSVISIEGVASLHGTKFAAMPDRNEISTFVAATVATRGKVFMRNANVTQINAMLALIRSIGVSYKKDVGGILIEAVNPLSAVSITTRPHPGFMTDWQPPFTVALTQCTGISTVHETVHSNRFEFVSTLTSMGANISLYNPEIDDLESVYDFSLEEYSNSFHACRIVGPSQLQGTVFNSHDIRADAALIIAGLCAEGESTLLESQHIDRGYEDLVLKLIQIGAQIRRID